MCSSFIFLAHSSHIFLYIKRFAVDSNSPALRSTGEHIATPAVHFFNMLTYCLYSCNPSVQKVQKYVSLFKTCIESAFLALVYNNVQKSQQIVFLQRQNESRWFRPQLVSAAPCLNVLHPHWVRYAVCYESF